MTAFCAAVDWGTSSFRLWVLGRDGEILGESRGDDGILSVPPRSFSDVLQAHLKAAGADQRLPVLVCGMAGAKQGWVEAPYVDVPANVTAICGCSIPVPDQDRTIRILPGVAQRDLRSPDVMRGEETQLIGLESPDALVCLPGTHSKWVILDGGRIAGFTTFMTGELYAVLGKHSILSHSVSDRIASAETPGFKDGLSVALAPDFSLSGALFGVRARGLVAEDPGDSGAYLSGLLIGSELAAVRSDHGAGGRIILMASGGLATLYEAAMQMAGFVVHRQDAETAVRRGLLIAAAHIWG